MCASEGMCTNEGKMVCATEGFAIMQLGTCATVGHCGKRNCQSDWTKKPISWQLVSQLLAGVTWSSVELKNQTTTALLASNTCVPACFALECSLNDRGRQFSTSTSTCSHADYIPRLA